MRAVHVTLLMWLMSPLTWGFDPTAPPGYEAGTVDSAMGKQSVYLVSPKKTVAPEWILRQIVYRVDGKSAVINGWVVQEGDTVKGAIIKRIEPEKVVLSAKGKDVVLSIAPDRPKVRR